MYLWYYNSIMEHIKAFIRSTIVKYGLSSGISFLVDYGMFALLLWMGLPIMISTYGARACSCVVNFILNRSTVFRSGGDPARQFILYILLVIASATISGLVVTWLYAQTHVHPVILKFCVEVVLFFANYLIQKHLIFRK